MLVAHDATNVRVCGWDADRHHPYHCPGCQQPVRCKQGAKVVWHFAHLSRDDCDLDGESVRHMEIKALVARRWRADLEVPLGKRRADAVVETRKLVLEVQCSPMSADEWDARERDYRAMGYKVAWVWDTSMLGQGDAFPPFVRESPTGAWSRTWPRHGGRGR
jgi:competence protein CoiA